MADADKIIQQGIRKRLRTTEVHEHLSPNNLRHDRKKSFCSRKVSPQTCLRHDYASTTEDELMLSRTADRIGLLAYTEDENTRRYSEDIGHHDYHTDKRSRTSDWPLRNADMTNEATCRPRVVLRDQYDRSISTSPHLRIAVKPRPSKFVEGSMKDRASQKPHPSYTEDSEQSCTNIEPKQNLSLNMNRGAQFDGCKDRIDIPPVSKSTIFRFGKSIAAAFNPSTWKIWPRQQEEDSHEKRVLAERHEKAMKIYKELKRTGQLGTLTHQARSDTQDKTTASDKHDSGVSFEECTSGTGTSHRTKLISTETKMDGKRHGRVFLNTPRLDSFTCCEDATCETTASLNPFLQSSGLTNRLPETLNNPQVLRRLPSRKDLQKQQKLVKRVSDLEGKLDAARRQLAEALGDPLPKEASHINRSCITPSILPSLPSERLLGAHVASSSSLGETAGVFGIGKAISIDNQTGPHCPSDKPYEVDADVLVNTSSEISRTFDGQYMDSTAADDSPVEQSARCTRQEFSFSLVAGSGTAKKRKVLGTDLSGNSGTCPQILPSVDDDGFEAAMPSIPKRAPGRPRKLQKIDPEPDHNTVEAIKTKPGFEAKSMLPLHGRKTKYLKRSPMRPAFEVFPQAGNSRIAKKDQTEIEPISTNLMSSLESTNTGTELSNGKTVVCHGIRDEIIRDFNPAEVSLTPQSLGVVDPRKAALAKNGVTVPHIEIDAHGDVSLEKKGLTGLNTDIRKSKVGNKQAFEWPADVF